MGMEELTGFGMRNCLTLPSLANKGFNSLIDKNNEPIYTYTDSFMKNFVRKAIEGSRRNALKQHYKCEFSDDAFNIISSEINVNGNECEILEKFFEFLNEHEKQYAEEFDSKHDEYRDIDQKGRTEYINKTFTMLPIYK